VDAFGPGLERAVVSQIGLLGDVQRGGKTFQLGDGAFADLLGNIADLVLESADRSRAVPRA
jgi:hypothetical protein